MIFYSTILVEFALYKGVSLGNIFFYPQILSSSPYINHFLQPDTIIPDQANPQAFNRYSYVGNNPVNFNDPTGHNADCGIGEACQMGHTNPNDYKPIKKPNEGGSGGGLDGESSSNSGSKCNILMSCDASATTLTYGSGLIGPPASTVKLPWWKNPAKLDNLANTLQDLATLASSTGASVTIASTTSGCIVGIEVGILPGCAAGYVGGVLFHTAVTNPIETGLSFASLLVTFQSDYLTNDLSFDPNSLTVMIGEDTRTSLATFGAGLIIADPLVDAGIDVYASGYNHGYFCGITTVGVCLSQ